MAVYSAVSIGCVTCCKSCIAAIAVRLAYSKGDSMTAAVKSSCIGIILTVVTGKTCYTCAREVYIAV